MTAMQLLVFIGIVSLVGAGTIYLAVKAYPQLEATMRYAAGRGRKHRPEEKERACESPKI